jgi:hypothetical protein
MKSKNSNPIIWGAWGGIVAAIIAGIAAYKGELPGGTVWGYGMGGFFWLWVVANIKNWLSEKMFNALK